MHEDTSSPPASHSSRTSCSGTSQDQSHGHSKRTPGARHKQQMKFVISFFDYVLFFFERSMRKLLLNPQGLFSSLLPLHRTMVFHTLPMQFQSTYWCTKGNLNIHLLIAMLCILFKTSVGICKGNRQVTAQSYEIFIETPVRCLTFAPSNRRCFECLPRAKFQCQRG